MPASTILLLESDAAAGESIATMLSAAGYKVTVTGDADDAFAKAVEHQLIIIDVSSGPRSAVEICREIRATPSMMAIPVMCVSATQEVEERIHFLEAGADDVMARPFDAREMEARVEALLLRFQRSKHVALVASPDGLTLGRVRRTVAVYSPKGGVGTTTVAVNVAIAAVAPRPDRVVLVDLALQFGGVATLLNLDPKQTIADVVRDEPSMREPELLRTYAMRHDSGLHVLAAPATPEAAETIAPGHVTSILATLLDGYDLVVVDAGSTLDERVLSVFAAAESVLLIVTPEIAALKGMHALLEYLGENGTVGLKSTFVLNDLFAREILKRRDVESFLGATMAVELPYDPFLYLKAVNEGVPIVTGAPKSIPAERLAKLSSIAFGGDGHIPVPVQGEARKPGGLFRRRR
ncbi:MAG: pilus assembly protein CpaE [Chloroflexota bacterium]|nr:pilus assembly protein CpaE [Chloroflexota bacterium]